mmetsp:Transcript_16271/g.30196  ORF Transcript_16271/g.30196 Transcript_16271/m.30196 type:complete len:349 (+) Transcript_16271:77-1123(+)
MTIAPPVVAFATTTTTTRKPMMQIQPVRRRVGFSKVNIIEFPYAIGDTPCSSGVPIGASYVAQHQTSFQLDFFERYRPERRTKSDLHISAEDRRALLLKSGYTSKEISEAAKEATRIRKQRSDTHNEIRSKLQSLMIRSRYPTKKRNTTKVNNRWSTQPASPAPTSALSLPACPSPVMTSPLKPTQRRQKKALQRRRLSQTASPITLQISCTEENQSNMCQQSRLSPLSNAAGRSAEYADRQTACQFNLTSQTCGEKYSPALTPKRKRQTGSFSFIRSPSLIPASGRCQVESMKYQGNKENDCNQDLSPVRKRQRTPVKLHRGDQPLVPPRRIRTPPPPSPIAAARMY